MAEQVEIPPETMALFINGPYTVLPDGRIDCTFAHPTLGPVPFTADPNDVEPHGRAAWAYARSQLP